jgi:hypothetical protein
MSSPDSPTTPTSYDDLAHYSYFHNPFANANRAESGQQLISAPVPESLVLVGKKPQEVPVWSRGSAPLPVKGQGTVVAHVKNAEALEFIFRSESGDGIALFVAVFSDHVGFWYGPSRPDFSPGDGDLTEIKGENAHRVSREGFVRPNKTDNHWLSIDPKNGRLKYGRGYVNATQILYEAPLMVRDEEKGVYKWIKPEVCPD